MIKKRIGSRRVLLIMALAVVLLFPANLSAQSFGFGDDINNDSPDSGFGGASSGTAGVKIGGDVNAELKFFYDDFNAAETMSLGNIFSGGLNFSAHGSLAEAVINIDLAPVWGNGQFPVSIDEAYVRGFFGPVNITGGYRKLTWGKADSLGPMDVVNPLDYSDLSNIGDPQSIKISRPLLHLSWNITYASRLEAVFVPWFEGHSFAGTGRWTPAQVTQLPPAIKAGLLGGLAVSPLAGLIPIVSPALDKWMNNLEIEDLLSGNYSTIKYAQAGLRFTTSIGPTDLGFQYYFGRLPRPAYTIDLAGFQQSLALNPPLTEDDVEVDQIKIAVNYNPYHQIGIDYAQVLGGFNIRAETGVNLTHDMKGTDGSVYNPSFFWCLGFDRNIFWDINLNVQGTGSVRLLHSKLGDNPMLETEYDSKATNTRITFFLSKNFLRDELAVKLTGIWGIEDMDFLLMPCVTWSREGFSAELAAGFFMGDKKGELGQYRDNSYIRIGMGYKF